MKKCENILSISHVINDPIHGPMDFSSQEKDLIKPIVDSSSFQRLRHIRQLGLAELVFPGAVHTRFNHSLGTCFVAKQLAMKAELFFDGKLNRTGELAIIAALMHDIGHGPLSHAFEALLKTDSTEISHEDWTQYFIDKLSKESAIFLNREEKELVIKAIRHEVKSESLLLADIVSSQLDADRLDYLLRDSHFCGVSYGIFDLKWLLRCITKINEVSKPPRLGIYRKGTGVIEQYVVARRFMHQNVYYNGKIKAAEYLMIQFLEELTNIIDEGKKRHLSKISRSLRGFLSCTARYKISPGKKTSETERAKLGFLDSAFQYYHSLSDYDIWQAMKEFSALNSRHPEKIELLADRLMSRKLPKVYPLDSNSVEGAAFVISEFQKRKRIQEWKLGVLKLPVKSYKSDKDPILLAQHDGTTRTLVTNSNLIGLIADKTESTNYLRIDQSVPEHDRNELIRQLIDKHYLAVGQTSSRKKRRKTKS